MSSSEYKVVVEQLSIDMFNIHTSLTTSNEEIAKLSARNELLNKRNEELELTTMHVENLKKEIEYLDNKVLCASQIEKAIRDEIAENELKLRAFKNSSSLLLSYHEKYQENAKAAIGFDYDTLKKRKGCAVTSDNKIVQENVPHILKNAKAPIFKETSFTIDEEALIIKQMLNDEDEAQSSEQPAPSRSESVKVEIK